MKKKKLKIFNDFMIARFSSPVLKNVPYAPSHLVSCLWFNASNLLGFTGLIHMLLLHLITYDNCVKGY